jgi:DNA-binding LacI/PurR family transcriptional regulator
VRIAAGSAAPNAAVPLTVIAYDAREFGRQAAGLLFGRIDGDRSWPSTTVLPTGWSSGS